MVGTLLQESLTKLKPLFVIELPAHTFNLFVVPFHLKIVLQLSISEIKGTCSLFFSAFDLKLHFGFFLRVHKLPQLDQACAKFLKTGITTKLDTYSRNLLLH